MALMDEPIAAIDTRMERLTVTGGVYLHELEEWFRDRGHHVAILSGLLIFRSAGQPHYPPHTAFAGETVVWDPTRQYLYVEKAQPSE